MKFGAPFLGAFALTDPKGIKEYVQTVEEMGFSHLFMDEILFNDNPDSIFHESLTLFAYLAGLTKKIKFVSGIMVLPKRQALLVARQAAEVDVLSNGRLRLGVGVGWRKPEFEALGIDFHARGKIIDEQIILLKECWNKEKVSFQGSYHRVDSIGINLRPVQQPIPIWIGGSADRVLRRAARLAEGWIIDESVSDALAQSVSKMFSYLDDYENDPKKFKMVKYLQLGKVPESEWRSKIIEWEKMGITHTAIIPSGGWGKNLDLSHCLKELATFLETVNA